MAFFRVCFDVAPLDIALEGMRTRCGFIKNLYVSAKSEAAAVTVARADLDLALSRNSKFNGADLSGAKFKVDEVERSSNFLKIFRPEGFVFYKI